MPSSKVRGARSSTTQPRAIHAGTTNTKKAKLARRLSNSRTSHDNFFLLYHRRSRHPITPYISTHTSSDHHLFGVPSSTHGQSCALHSRESQPSTTVGPDSHFSKLYNKHPHILRFPEPRIPQPQSNTFSVILPPPPPATNDFQHFPTMISMSR